ncbi:hypothetical protein SMU40_05164 [Streptococcus mutans 15VF2]|nr:hypothetical protein SMU36_04506 [Streptococcus mutans 4VF1]EMB73872.1 hypothetical protein SMU40_05164 [Streptococcus mutans 15VF2]
MKAGQKMLVKKAKSLSLHELGKFLTFKKEII